MSGSNVGGLLVLGVAAGVGALAFKAFSKDDKKSDSVIGGGGLDEDACDASLDKLPKPFLDMLTDPATDLSNPVVVDSIASQLSAAGFTQQANCLRKFKHVITEHHDTSGDGSVDGCASLINSNPAFTAEQKANILQALKEGSSANIRSLANAFRPINAPIANCMDGIADAKDAAGTGAGGVKLDATAFKSLMGGVPAMGSSPAPVVTSGAIPYNGATLTG